MKMLAVCAAGLTFSTLIGGGIGIFCKNGKGKSYDCMLALAAGIMLYASANSLIAPSFEEGVLSVSLALAGLFSGVLTVSLFESAPKILMRIASPSVCGEKNDTAPILIFVAAAMLHKLPEGIASGVGCRVGDGAAVSLSLGLAIQNVPDGLIVAAPLCAIGVKRKKVMCAVFLTSLVSVIGMLIGYFGAAAGRKLTCFALALAGGMMIYVSCSLLAQIKINRYSACAIVLGIATMEILGRMI